MNNNTQTEDSCNTVVTVVNTEQNSLNDNITEPVVTVVTKQMPILNRMESQEQIEYVKKYGGLKPRRNSKTKYKGQRFDSADYFQKLDRLRNSSESTSDKELSNSAPN